MAILRAAHDLSREAYDRIIAAQRPNEFDLRGYAAKANQLLERVNQAPKMAAEAANRTEQRRREPGRGRSGFDLFPGRSKTERTSSDSFHKN
jgi:hypothetical protein